MPFICLPACLPVCLSVCLSVGLSACLSLCLSVCLCVSVCLLKAAELQGLCPGMGKLFPNPLFVCVNLCKPPALQLISGISFAYLPVQLAYRL